MTQSVKPADFARRKFWALTKGWAPRVSGLVQVNNGVGVNSPGAPNAGAALIPSIAINMATAVNNARKRFFMRYPLSVKSEARGSPAALRNGRK